MQAGESQYHVDNTRKLDDSGNYPHGNTVTSKALVSLEPEGTLDGTRAVCLEDDSLLLTSVVFNPYFLHLLIAIQRYTRALG